MRPIQAHLTLRPLSFIEAAWVRTELRKLPSIMEITQVFPKDSDPELAALHVVVLTDGPELEADIATIRKHPHVESFETKSPMTTRR